MCTYVERAHCTSVYTTVHSVSVGWSVQAQSSVRGHHQTVAPVLGRHRPVSSEQRDDSEITSRQSQSA